MPLNIAFIVIILGWVGKPSLAHANPKINGDECNGHNLFEDLQNSQKFCRWKRGDPRSFNFHPHF